MKAAPISTDERERMQDLLSYRILDTPPELTYDDLTLLASTICEAPIALVSLVDGERQWFKSKRGLDASETPRDISFCGHAIQGNEIFEIPDAQLDERFKDNPLVAGNPKVRFYAGSPLKSPQGHNLGTLCVIGHQPAKLSTHQRHCLSAISRLVVNQFDAHKASLILAEKYEALTALTGRFVESSKMAALGEMSAGLAHEINTPLQTISTSNELIGELLGERTPSEVVDAMATIEKTVRNLSEIVLGLRAIARDSSGDEKTPQSLAEIVTTALALCRKRVERLRIELASPKIDRDLRIDCRASQIGQVLLNLLNNAIDAVEGMSTAWIKINHEVTAEWIHLTVTDSGPPIAPAIREKMGQPFFTTKPIGKGTGLGLSISTGIVEAHGGQLVIQPSQGNTCIRVSLRRSPKDNGPSLA